MRDLLIVTATRERPAGARRLINAVSATSRVRTDLVFGIDDDDRSYDSFDFGRAMVFRGPRRDVAEWTNYITRFCAEDYLAVASLGDDHVPVTPGWDEQLLAALHGRMGVAYGNDLYQGERWPTAAVVSSPVVIALGYMAPPGVHHLYIDCFWKRLGQDLDCLEYLPDVIIEHVHPSAGKAELDDSYRRSNSADQYAHDKTAYEEFLAQRWPRELQRLRDTLRA